MSFGVRGFGASSIAGLEDELPKPPPCAHGLELAGTCPSSELGKPRSKTPGAGTQGALGIVREATLCKVLAVGKKPKITSRHAAPVDAMRSRGPVRKNGEKTFKSALSTYSSVVLILSLEGI